MTVPLSVLDLCPIVAGGTAAAAFRNTVDLAQHAEQWGYQRFWLAEHHNMPGIASAATAVLIGHVGAGTKTIRIGAGDAGRGQRDLPRTVHAVGTSPAAVPDARRQCGGG